MNRRRFLRLLGGSAVAGAGAAVVDPVGRAAPSAAVKGPPPVEVTTSAAGTAPGNILLTPPPDPDHRYRHGPMIVDPSGNLVWFRSVDRGVTNLKMQSYRGEPVLTWWKGHELPVGFGIGVYEIMDSAERRVATVHAGGGLKGGDLHEFTLSPEGTALFSAYHARPFDLSPVGGPKDGLLLDSLLQEVDVPTGRVLFQWRASDHVDLSESYNALPPTPDTAWDFFHINSIAVAGDGDLIVSGRHAWCVFKVDRSTGRIVWRLNGKRSDFTMGPGSPFCWQHHAQVHPGHLVTVFDNGAGPTWVESTSRGLKLRLDLRAMTAELLQEYLPDPEILCTYMGSMQLLPNGNAFIDWGGHPVFTEHAPDGQLLYSASMPKLINSYRAFKAPWPPT